MNGPSLMSNCLLIILVIGSCVIFGGFPSKFSKCCFHSFILSCWFAALENYFYFAAFDPGVKATEILNVGWLVVFYGISTFVGYLTPNPFLCK